MLILKPLRALGDLGTMAVVYREAREDDAEAIMDFARKTFRDTFFEAAGYSENDIATYFASDYNLEIVKSWVSDRNIFLYLALDESESRIVGFLSVGGPSRLPHDGVSDMTGEIKKLYIAEPFKGKDVAHTLMLEGLRWFTHADCAFSGDVYISVWSQNIRAQKFYSKFGAYKVSDYLYPVGTTMDKEEVWKIDRKVVLQKVI